MFGAPFVEEEQKEVAVSKGKRSALLCYLAYYQDWVERSDFIALFWAETDDKQARSNMRTLLTRASKQFKTYGVEVEKTRIRWLVESDVAIFKEAIAAEDWKTAVSTYSGQLLYRFEVGDMLQFEDWLMLERSTIFEQFKGAVNYHNKELIEEANYRDSVAVLEKFYLLSKEDEEVEYHEDDLLEYLRSLALDQQWKKALDTFDSYKRQVVREFNLEHFEPEEATKQLIENIRLAKRQNQDVSVDVPKLEQIVTVNTTHELDEELSSKELDNIGFYLLVSYYFVEAIQIGFNDKQSIIAKALSLDYEACLVLFRKLRKLDLVDENGFTQNKDMILEKLSVQPELKPYILLQLIDASDHDLFTKQLSQTYIDEVGTLSESMIAKISPLYVTEAKQAFERGKYSEVINLLIPIHEAESYFGLEPNSESAFFLAHSLEREGNFIKAREVLEGTEKTLNIELLMLTIDYRTGDFDNSGNELESMEASFSARPSWAKAQCYNLKGNLALRQGEFEQAVQYFREAESLWDMLDEQNRRVGEITNIALTKDYLGDLEEAEKMLNQALKLCVQDNVSELEEIRVLYNWSVIYNDRAYENNNQEFRTIANEKYHSALELAKEAGQMALLARLSYSEGLRFEDMGDTESAIAAYEEARRMARETGEWMVLATATFHLGYVNNDLVRAKQGLDLMEANGGFDGTQLELFRESYQQLSNQGGSSLSA